MKNSSYLSLIIPLIFTAISMFLINFHEMWRDELQAWLLARDSASLPALFANLKYEGHPGLWHLMLFPLTRIFNTPEVMQYFHIGVAATSIFVLTRWSPFNTLQKILLSFSYFLFFEYSMIARNYAIGVLLIFLICTLFPKRREYSLAIGGALFLLSHTSVLGLIFAMCFFSTILFEEIAAGGHKSECRRLGALDIAAITIAVVGFITSIIQIFPPQDSGFATEWRLHPDLLGLQSIYGALIGAYFPLPTLSLSFWNSLVFLSSAPVFVLSSVILVSLIYFVSKFLLSKPTALFLYASVSFSLLLFFYTKYSGYLRHHGFLFIALIAALWIHDFCGKWYFRSNIKTNAGVESKIFGGLLSLLFFTHTMAGLVAVAMDYRYPFSGAKETAKFITQNNLEQFNIIGYSRSNSLAVAGYLTNKELFYLEQQRFGTFVRWDNSRVMDINLELLELTATKLAMNGSGVLFVSSRSLEDFGFYNSSFVKLFESDDTIVGNEKFYLYRFITPPTH